MGKFLLHAITPGGILKAGSYTVPHGVTHIKVQMTGGGGGGSGTGQTLGSLETKTYTRSYTLGQVRALKFMTQYFLKRFGVARYIVDVTLNKTEGGQPGYPDTYRVRIRYR